MNALPENTHALQTQVVHTQEKEEFRPTNTIDNSSYRWIKSGDFVGKRGAFYKIGVEQRNNLIHTVYFKLITPETATELHIPR